MTSEVSARLIKLSLEEKEHFLGEVPRLWLEGRQIHKLYLLLADYDFINTKINYNQFGIRSLINDYIAIADSKL